MEIRDISVPEVYKTSADFRFFMRWIELSLQEIQYNTENIVDLLDPLRCRADLLWMLADTMGFKYDNRFPSAYNRLILLYFMSMIRHKGSKDGVSLAAEVNLAQFNVLNYGDENPINYDRLDDTTIPVNSVYVTPHVAEGYIDVVYFSSHIPKDACIEYVRPIGMYLFQNAGVEYDGTTKISIDSRLTDIDDAGMSIGPTHVGHYRREDYARMEYMFNEPEHVISTNHPRRPVYYRNSKYEGAPDVHIDPGHRTLYSLQLCNGEHVVRSLIPEIFSLGYGPQDASDTYPDDYLDTPDRPEWNLRYDKDLEISVSENVYTIESDSPDILHPKPAVQKIMGSIGDNITADTDVVYYKDEE